MNPDEYTAMYQVEDSHWWYVGMRAIAEALLATQWLEPSVAILDVGCGTGGNLAWLTCYGTAWGMDVATLALNYCRQRSPDRLVQASVLALPFADASFGLVTSFDVLYHREVADDTQALREIRRVLRPRGLLLLRLPAYQWLYSGHDRAVHTARRYTASEVTHKVAAAGLVPLRVTYANTILFPIAVVHRLAKRRSGASDVILPPPPINSFLTAVLRVEAWWLRHGGFPFGLSVFCLAQRGP